MLDRPRGHRGIRLKNAIAHRGLVLLVDDKLDIDMVGA